nr:hypothetical protein [Tanacetum cinerariifolium]
RPLPWGLRGGGCCHGEGMVVRGVSGGVVVVGSGCGVDEGGKWRRVVASDIVDRIDRKVGNNFGFAEKSPPEKFSDDGGVVAGGGGRWSAAAVGRERINKSVCVYLLL